ncbi:MAG: hypothetical protein RBT74_13755 [Tenuifilaceae bacterium]|jgi:hypothetical protein|nr:hypothetical protein [Tenuifilaceae bacterium]
MKTVNLFLKSIITLFLIGSVIYSSAQDVQIPFCDNIQLIDARMGSTVPKLMVYKDFQQATLLKTGDGLVLNIVYKVNGVFHFDKVSITQDELDEICATIQPKKSATIFSEEGSPTQEARRRLIFSSTAFSLGYYSWAIPAALKAEDYKSYTASYMLIGGAGFFVPLIATGHNDITNGMARGFTVGAANGFVHGGALSLLFFGDNIEYENYIGFTSIFSITESLLGLSMAKKYDYSWGRMSIMGSGGLWGAAAGAALPVILFESEEPRLYGLSSLAGSVGGIMAANYLYKQQPITHGDATIINTTGALGLHWTAVMMVTFEMNSARGIVGLMLAGASGGLAYGIHKTKGYDYTRQQGNLISLGTYAGGLIGGGLGVLAESEEKGMLWLTALGATGGFLLSDYVLKENRKNRSSNSPNYSFQINPAGVLGALNSNYLPKTNDIRVGNSIANFRLTF